MIFVGVVETYFLSKWRWKKIKSEGNRGECWRVDPSFSKTKSAQRAIEVIIKTEGEGMEYVESFLNAEQINTILMDYTFPIFKQDILQGREVEFTYEGSLYSITNTPIGFCFSKFY